MRNKEIGGKKSWKLEDGSWELQLLFSLMDLNDHNTAVLQSLQFIEKKRIDWQRLGQLSAEHHLRPWLYSFYKQLPEGIVPAEVMEAYDRLENQIRFRQLKHIREFFRIKERLEEEGIEIIPFKGFRLAEGYYGNMALRESSDLDVLIRIKDLPRIIEFMKDLDYVSETDWDKANYPISHILKLGPEYNLDLWENGQRIAHVELHWQISGPPLNIGCFYEEMQEFITEAEFQGKKYSCFTPEGDLLMAAFHHGGKEEWIRLGHILDIGMILHKYPEAEYLKVIQWAERRNISRIVLIGILLAHQLCQVTIPESIREKANAPEILALTKNRMEKIHRLAFKKSNIHLRLNSTLYHLQSRDTLPARFRLALNYPAHFLLRGRLKLERLVRAAL